MFLNILYYIFFGWGCFLFLFTIFVCYIRPRHIVPGVFHEGWSNRILEGNYEEIDENVLKSAEKLADKLYFDNEYNKSMAVNRYVNAFNEIKKSDVIIIYNSGGFGWAEFSIVPSWPTIIEGIQNLLKENNLSSCVINYFRTFPNFWSMKTEAEVMFGDYPYKIDELEGFINIILNNTKAKVLLTGESQGAAVCEFTVQRFKNNNRVFSLQTGSPFWNVSKPFNRSLVINDNGKHWDTFAAGAWGYMIKCNILKFMHKLEINDSGNILNVLVAPGHEYSWEMEKVNKEIKDFITNELLNGE